MKAAELFVRCLENEDMDYIFGIPGEENIDMMDVLLDSPIRFITTRHLLVGFLFVHSGFGKYRKLRKFGGERSILGRIVSWTGNSDAAGGAGRGAASLTLSESSSPYV